MRACREGTHSRRVANMGSRGAARRIQGRRCAAARQQNRRGFKTENIKRTRQVERCAYLWALIVALQTAGMAAQYMQWQYVNVLIMAMMAVPSSLVTMTSTDVLIGDIGTWLTAALAVAEVLTIGAVMQQDHATWDTWLVESAITAWLAMKATLQWADALPKISKHGMLSMLREGGGE